MGRKQTVKLIEVDAGYDTCCLEWGGPRDKNGYGKSNRRINGKRINYAHRYFYTLEHGDIPDGMTIDHLCKNTSCCNVEHLEAVSHRDNLLRGNGWAAINARKTHCKNGHEYDSIRSDTGCRYCSICRKEYNRLQREKKRTRMVI